MAQAANRRATKKDANYSEREPVNTQSALQSSTHHAWPRRKS